jgi:GNAT superfamily N-acetyltransferase
MGYNSILFLLFIILICIIAVIIINSITHGIASGGSDKAAPISATVPHLSEAVPHLGKAVPHLGEAVPMSMAMTMSYTISGESNGLDYSILRQMFKKNGNDYGITWIEKPVLEKVNISFGSFGGFSNKKSNNLNLSPEFYKQSASIKNVLDGHSGFVNKIELYATIKRLIPNGIKYIPTTYTVSEFSIFQNLNKSKDSLGKAFPKGEDSLGKAFPKGLAILKKNFSCKQQGVRIIESMSDYYKAKKELDIKEDGIISEYITNPLLLDGKKIHLRIYYLLSIISGITKCSAYHEYRIYISEEKYVKGDWLNPKIHISGVSGKLINRRYYWPDDISAHYDIKHINKQLSEFNNVVCMALASSGVKNYSESNAGYQLYGADVLLTDTFDPYLLEINKHPGFSQFGESTGWDEYIKSFSTNFFQFILSNTAFSYLGLCKQPPAMVAFIGNGVLSQFGEILLKCKLIPIIYAAKAEIAAAKQIHFYDTISYEAVYKECSPYNIFLIEYSTEQIEGTQNMQSSSGIIGFIGLTLHSYIKIAIVEEYQNRGIATAMIAQLMEIQYARHYTSQHILIMIKKKNEFLDKIANKLHFKYDEKNRKFTRNCKLTDAIIKKINNGQLLTYKTFSDDMIKNNIFSLPHMAPSNSQFVHLLYNEFSGDRKINKSSTGNRYNRAFIYQGAELKSSLVSKILANIILFKKHIYDKYSTIDIFDKKANIIEPSSLYNICDENSSLQVFEGENLPKNTAYIEEYTPPFLIDNRLIVLRCHILIYISGNNIIKYFALTHKNIIFDNKEYDMHKNQYKTDSDKLNKYKFPDDFKTGELSEIANNSEILDNFITKLIHLINDIDYNSLKPYSESNSGFLTIVADIKFIKKNKWHPILNNIWNYAIVKNRQNINILEDYYKWIQNCAIAPHFGFHHHYMAPILCSIRNPISKDLDANLIAELSLQFNQNRDSVDILQSGKKIGNIHLNIVYNIIELKKIDIKEPKLILNIIFVLMDILAAYYAPNTPQFIFLPLDTKVLDMHQHWQNYVAFELQFFKGRPFDDNKTEYFIKKCR